MVLKDVLISFIGHTGTTQRLLLVWAYPLVLGPVGVCITCGTSYGVGGYENVELPLVLYGMLSPFDVLNC